MPIKVLHLFDKYLNSTMNWAAALLHEARGVDHEIAAPWIVQNEFHHPEFSYHYGFFQSIYGKHVKSEWEGGRWEKIVRGLESKTGWWLNRLEAQQFDIIHAHFGPVGCKALPLARNTGKPLVVSFYGYDYDKALIVNPKLRDKYLEMFELATVCIALGSATAQMLMSAGCPESKIQLIPPSIADSSVLFEPNKARHEPFRLLQVSSFTEKKGLVDTIAAFAEALKKKKNLHLTLIGEIVEPAIYQEVLRRIIQYQLQEKVEILGFMPNAEVRSRLLDFDGFIHPSFRTPKGDTEGLPVSILEALGSGLPVVSTHHADIPSAVHHGISGFLCQPRNINEITTAILALAEMPAHQFELFRQNSRRIIQTEFALSQAARKLEAVYQSIA